MPGKHLIDTLIFIFCATSAQKNLFIFFRVFGVRMGHRPFQNFWIRPWKERKKQPGRQGGEREGRQGGRGGRAGRKRGRAGRQEGVRRAGRERGRVGRERVRAGRQAGGDGGHADPVLLNTFHLVLTLTS